MSCDDLRCMPVRTSENNKNSSGDEIANVNFYAGHPEATRIHRIKQNNAVQGHSRSPILVAIESSYTVSY